MTQSEVNEKEKGRHKRGNKIVLLWHAATKATATEQEQPTPSTLTPKGKASVSATTPALAKDSKGQADLLAQLMAQVKEQGVQIQALKASF